MTVQRVVEGEVDDREPALAQDVPGTDDTQVRKLISYTRPQL